MARPCPVTRPLASSAPSAMSSLRASASMPGLGGVRKASPSPLPAPQSASSSASGARSATSISAGGKAASAPSSPLVHMRKHSPGATRPARPQRWAASALETRSVTSRAMPLPGSNRARRASPASTTTRTPGMVSEVSAIEVASTTRRRPAGAGLSAARWALKSSAPYSGSASASAGRTGARAASARRISPSPGRNTSTSPSVPVIASITCSATWCSSRARLSSGRLRQRVSTGKARPSARITGASSSRAATGAASSVADITTSSRSSRSAPRASQLSASPRSALRERS